MTYPEQRKLPSDPEDLNDFRAETFAGALEEHACDYGDSRKPYSTQIEELMANMGHWDDRNHSGKAPLSDYILAGMIAYDDQTEGEGKAFTSLLSPTVLILTHKHHGDTYREIYILTPATLTRLQPILKNDEALAKEFNLPFDKTPHPGAERTSVTADVVTAEYL